MKCKSTTPLLVLSFLSLTSAKCYQQVCFTTRASQGSCDSTSQCTFSTLNAWGAHNRSMPDSNIGNWLIDINAEYHIGWEAQDDSYPVRLAWHFYGEDGVDEEGMRNAPMRWAKNFTKGTTETTLNFTEILFGSFPNPLTNLTTWEALSLATYYGENFLTVSQPTNPDFQADGEDRRDLENFGLSPTFSPQASFVSAYPRAAWNRARRYYREEGERKVGLAAGLGVGLGVPVVVFLCTTLGYIWGKREMRRWMEGKMKEKGMELKKM